MSGYKNFAVVGAGRLGKYILDEFATKLAQGTISSVALLARSAEGHDELKAKGVKIIVVDYSSPTLKSSLPNIDVIVSTLGGEGLALQLPLALAAKKAGVKLFAPSEFSLPTDELTEEAFQSKNVFKAKLKEIGLPSTVYYTGLFTDFVLAPGYDFINGFAEIFGFDFKNQKVVIEGEGTTPVSWTTRTDIARFVVHSLTAFPKEKLEWQIIPIEGERLSFNQIIEQWNARTGKTLSVIHNPISKAKEAYEKDPSDFLSLLKIKIDAGRYEISSKEESERVNNLWPEFKPAKVLDVVTKIYGV